MPRSMLQLRMQALARHLEDAEDPSTWKDTLALENFFVDDELWIVATGKIHEEAMSQLKDIEDTMSDLDRGECTEEQAWRQYVKIQRRSEHIFRECLELLGGLALRDRITDEHICRFADELIKESARAVGRPFSFAIPTLEETLSSALRRVASVRFPEWHLWTLPLVAHEYGEVLIEDHTKLRRFVEEMAQELASEAGELEDDGAVRQMERRVRILIADSFATYTIGPAYACATLLLRLNPLLPGGQERAAMVLGTLKAMSEASNPPPPFRDIAAELEEYWKVSVAAALGADLDNQTTGPALTTLVDPRKVIRQFEYWFVGITNRAYSKNDWNFAVRWSDDWLRDIRNDMPELGIPEPIEPTRRLRDALNASWRCRVEAARDFGPEEAEAVETLVQRIADAGRGLCEAIIDARGGVGMSGGVQVGAAPRPLSPRPANGR
jgi:hypothetical protein